YGALQALSPAFGPGESDGDAMTADPLFDPQGDHASPAPVERVNRIVPAVPVERSAGAGRYVGGGDDDRLSLARRGGSNLQRGGVKRCGGEQCNQGLRKPEHGSNLRSDAVSVVERTEPLIGTASLNR